MLFLLPKVFSPFLFLLMTPDTVWHSIRNDAILRLICWSSHTLNTAQGHSSSCLGTDVVWTLIYISVNNPICCPMSGFFHLFFPTENMWHQSFFLARFSHFNPSCECRKEKKKDGSVSMEAHSSWGSLITVMAERETEDERRERWSAADMAGISRQRWDESTYSAATLCCWYEAVTSHPAQYRRALSQWSRRVSQNGEEVNALWSDRQTYCISIVHWITASLAALRGP